jgi:tetratricopeptide (TPR) repeat protein
MSIAADVEQLRKTWLELGMASQMADELGTYLEQSGRDLDAVIDVASKLRHQRLYHEALVTYDLGERWFPNDRYISNNRGVVNRDWGHLDEAVAVFERALEIEPKYSKALEGRSDSLLLRGDFAEAVAGYRIVIEEHPDQAITWRNLAIALSGAGKPQESIDAYECSLDLAPNDTQTLFDYAGLLAQVGRAGDAIVILDRLLKLDADDSDARQKRSRLESTPEALPDIQYPAPPRESLVIRYRRSKEELDRVAALVNATADETVPPKPPRLFISYRWGNEEQDAWVVRLVSALESRGYDVVFDRTVQSQRSEPLPVPNLVALIAGCTHFVPILTEGYRRRVENQPHAALVIEDGWVFDEYQVALRLSAARRLILQGVWRSGHVVPSPFTRENVCNFRDDAAFNACLDEHFPIRMARITGLRRDGTGRTIGPIPRTEIQRFGQQLEATGDFDQFLITHL